MNLSDADLMARVSGHTHNPPTAEGKRWSVQIFNHELWRAEYYTVLADDADQARKVMAEHVIRIQQDSLLDDDCPMGSVEIMDDIEEEDE